MNAHQNIAGIVRGHTSEQHPPFDDSDEWDQVTDESEGVLEQHIEDEEEEEEDDDSGRRLFKCLQLDLSSFGLEKAGLAHQFSGLLTGERINLLYSSTFR